MPARPRRQDTSAPSLLACWREESALWDWAGHGEPVRRQHEQTLELIRRNQAILVPFLARRLEPPDHRLREAICRWLDHVPWVTWRPSFAPDWSGTARRWLEELGPEARSVTPLLEAKLRRPRSPRGGDCGSGGGDLS